MKRSILAARRARLRPAGVEAGFSLTEMLISLTVSVVLIVSVLALFDANARLSRVQNDVAEVQQSQRVAQSDLVRMARMVGRGGLPAGAVPAGLAMGVRNNAAASEYVSPGDASTPEVLEGTDVVTVRGVFNTPIYQVAYGDAANFTLDADPGVATTGTVRITNPTNTGIPQDLQPLIDAVNEDRPEALILVSPVSDQNYAVVELDPGNSNVTDPDALSLAFWVRGGPKSAPYATLSPGGAYPATMNNAAYVGILEEYRYYIRERWVDGRPLPALFRARVYPGSEIPHPADSVAWGIEVAQNVFDLQASYGIDVDGDEMVADGTLLDGVNPDNDEWLFNHPNDNTNFATWNAGELFFLRLTTLVRTDRGDNRYQAPTLVFVEDHPYAGSPFNAEDERTHRRRSVETLVDMRNM